MELPRGFQEIAEVIGQENAEHLIRNLPTDTEGGTTRTILYARTESQFARRTVFFGSVNPRSFLHDPTGNSRYWTIECAAIDLEAQRALDMQQIWAEIYALYQAGEPYRLTADEM